MKVHEGNTTEDASLFVLGMDDKNWATNEGGKLWTRNPKDPNTIGNQNREYNEDIQQ
jgi:hypothetical protein